MSDTVTSLTGIQKAALVLMQMDQKNAAQTLRQFSEAEAEEIATEIVRLTRVEPALVEAAIADFHRTAMSAAASAHGGRDVAAELLEATFGAERAHGLLEQMSANMESASFEFLDSSDPQHIFGLLEDELPQTIALVLAHFSAVRSAAVLAKFDPAVQAEIAQALATMTTAVPDAVELVVDALKSQARTGSTSGARTRTLGGVQPLVDIINRAESEDEQALLEALDETNPALANEVRALMITFDDLVRFEKKHVQLILRGVDPAILALAMRGASAEVTALVRENMTERNRETLDEEIGLLGQVRKKQVEAARAEVVRSIRELEAEGTVAIQRIDENQQEDDDYVD